MRLTFLLICTFIWPSISAAQMTDLDCDDSARMAERLTEVLGAKRQGIGLRDPETTLEIWVQARNHDWFVVQSYANGTSCIVAIGEYWEGEVVGPA